MNVVEDVLHDMSKCIVIGCDNKKYRKGSLCEFHRNNTPKLNPTTTEHNKQALLEAFTAGWDAAHNNRFSIGVNFDKWYHKKAGEK